MTASRTSRAVAATHRRMPLRTYLDYRLGRGQPWWRQTYNVLARPLTAPSFAAFWRAWNPVWGYWLYHWVYRPARRLLPHPAAVLVTFAASGVVHNLLAALLSRRLNPFVTVWFALYGVVTVASEALRMDLSRLPAPVRVVVNLAYLVGCYLLVSPLLPPLTQERPMQRWAAHPAYSPEYLLMSLLTMDAWPWTVAKLAVVLSSSFVATAGLCPLVRARLPRRRPDPTAASRSGVGRRGAAAARGADCRRRA